jgi:hypothetical protein
MDKNLFKKPETPDLATPAAQRSYIEEAHSAAELLQKELEINQMEQTLLQKRIQMMQSFVNDLPSSDPQYSMLLAQLQMDRLELDELRLREQSIAERLREKGRISKRGSSN